MAGFGFAQSENESMILYDNTWAGEYRWAIQTSQGVLRGVLLNKGRLGIILGKTCRRANQGTSNLPKESAEHTGRRSGKGGGELYIVITR